MSFLRLLFVAVALGAPRPVDAVIVWDPPQNIRADTDVITNGALVFAYEYGYAFAANATVNGVPFTALENGSVSPGLINPMPINDQAFYPYGQVSTPYQRIIGGAAYDGEDQSFILTLTNLINGHEYRAQVWVSDPRSSLGPSIYERSESASSPGGNSVVLRYNQTYPSGSGSVSVGQCCVGAFVASGAAQSFSLTGLPTGATQTPSQLNAIQLRDLGPRPRAAVSYYVDPVNGSDANPGVSAAAAFRTIQRASSSLVAGDTCLLSGGVYHETIQPWNNGVDGAPITYAALSNQRVTIDAANPVTNWTYLSNGIFQASVTWDLGEGYNQVFVDGVMLHEARYPAYGTGDALHPGAAPVTISKSQPQIVVSPAWNGFAANDLAGAWFSGGVGFDWGWQAAQVLSSAGSNITVAPLPNNWWFDGEGVGFLWGSLKFLTSDNQWYLQANGSHSTLFLRLTGGADPSSRQVEMKQRSCCVAVTNLSHITVAGLNFIGGEVVFIGDNNVLRNCQAQYLDHYLLPVSRPDGILLSGAGNIVSACVIANTAGNGISSSGANNLITRNHITNTDYAGTYSCAISLGGIGDAAIFNTAAQSGRDILHPGGGPGAAGGAPGANVQFNDLSFPGLLCKDLGVIYGAANSHIAFNWLHDNNYPGPTPLVYLDNWNYSNTVDHNVCWNNGGFPGITINSPAAGDRIYNNTVFNCAWSLAPGNNAWNTTNGAIGNPDPAFWTRYVDEYLAANNLFLSSSPQTELADWTRQKFQLLPGASAVDAGLVVPGVTDGYAGSAPDLGAYEQGAPPWTAGVDSRPTLTVSRAPDGSLVLGASPDAIFYSLYSTTNPAPPVVWTQVPGSPRISGPSWSFQLPAPNASTALYRLQSPWD